MSITVMNPAEFAEKCRDGAGYCLVDVRTPGEYDSGHADGAQLMPLPDFDPKKARERAGNRPLALICQSGSRAKKAAEACQQAGVECCVVEGGTEAWKAAGLPVARAAGKARTGMTIERQVRLGAGAMAAVGALLALVVHPLWAIVPLFVGCGLAVAGATGWCGLALVLARMPWNR